MSLPSLVVTRRKLVGWLRENDHAGGTLFILLLTLLWVGEWRRLKLCGKERKRLFFNLLSDPMGA